MSLPSYLQQSFESKRATGGNLTLGVDAFLGMFFGVLWPLTIIAWVVYLASDFLYNKFYKVKEN